MLTPGDFFVPGLGPVSLKGDGSGSGLVAYPAEVFTTPLLDFTVPTLGIELVPAKPGHYPIQLTNPRTIIIESVSGTQATAAQIRAGSDPAHTNYLPLTNQPSNANVNGAVPPSFAPGSNVVNTTHRIPNTPVIFDLVTGAVGTAPGFVLKARYMTVVIWISVNQ